MVFVYMGVFSECNIIIHYNSVKKYMVSCCRHHQQGRHQCAVGDLLLTPASAPID